MHHPSPIIDLRAERSTPRPALFLSIAFLGILTWLALSIAFRDLDFAPRMRALDALWGWVSIALLQIALARPGESRSLRWAIAASLLAGIAVTVLRNTLPPGQVGWHSGLPQADAVLLAIAALLSLLRGVAGLSGRAVRAADLWTLLAIQWLLVWAAAFVLLTWRQQNGILALPRQILAELAILGVGTHASLGLALAFLPPALGLPIKERAALVTLVAYNLGLILLATAWIWTFGVAWIGYLLMLFGVAFYLVAMAGLLRGKARIVPLVVLAGVALLGAAVVMRPFDNGAFAAWRHAAAGGCIGLCALLGAALPAFRTGDPRAIAAAGLLLYLAGVVSRVAIELYETVNAAAHEAPALGSLLEIGGLVLVAAASLRAVRIARQASAGEAS